MIFLNFDLMKKAASIVFSLLLIVSVLHISVATHYCEDHLAAVKVSTDGELASCGMEENQIPAAQPEFNDGCCTNHLIHYSVDRQYTPSLLKIDTPVQQVIHTFIVPVTEQVSFNNPSQYSNQICSPPGNSFPNVVEQDYICVFLI